MPAIDIDQLLDEIAEGKSLRRTLADHGLNSTAFYKMLADDVQLSRRYARAVDIRADLAADDVVTIADEEKDAARARNRIDARKWSASKMNPGKFSDRVDINVTQTVDLNAAMALADSRLRPVSDQREGVIDLVLDESGTYTPEPTDNKSADPDVDIFS